MRKFAIVVLVIVLLILAGVAVYGLLMVRNGFSARAQPSAAEAFIARKARLMAIPKGARELKNPVALNDDVLRKAMQHWAHHCAICHAVNGSGNTVIGQNLYPQAPDMRQPPTQNLRDGEIFYIIENGIRLSGMPAWGEPGEQDESWELVHLIRHLPRLTPDEEKWMEQFTPKSPEELEQQKSEEEFLGGGKPAPRKPETKHH